MRGMDNDLSTIAWLTIRPLGVPMLYLLALSVKAEHVGQEGAKDAALSLITRMCRHTGLITGHTSEWQQGFLHH
jgi:hypothetical protein